MTYRLVSREIQALLIGNQCWHQTFEHEPVRTSEEAAKVRSGYSLAQGAKAIVIKVRGTDRNQKFAMIVARAHEKFDSKKVRRILHAKDIKFATEEEVAQVTGGVEPGAVPPFGNMFGLQVIVDRRLFDNERIVFNAGDRRFSIAMKASDYRKLVNPHVADIV